MTTTKDEIAKRWFDVLHDEEPPPMPSPFYEDGVGRNPDDRREDAEDDG